MSKKKVVKKKTTKDLVKSIGTNYWAIAAIILALVLLFSLMANSNCTGNVISSSEAGDIVKDFGEQQGADLTVINIEQSSGLYEVTIELDGQSLPVYLTSDGKNLVPQLIPLTGLAEAETKPASSDIPKSDKPLVELFVMTHCPYGTQAEKGFIPMMKVLKNVADVKIRFVHYFMHAPEETETPIQVCIREEQTDKYLDYLECFLEGDGNADASGYIGAGNDPVVCMQRANVDKTVVDECIASKRWEEYYAIDSELSQGYGVQGSPTLIINGAVSKAGRDTSSYLNAACDAFNSAPSECETEVSSDAPSPGFGSSITGNVVSGSC